MANKCTPTSYGGKLKMCEVNYNHPLLTAVIFNPVQHNTAPVTKHKQKAPLCAKRTCKFLFLAPQSPSGLPCKPAIMLAWALC